MTSFFDILKPRIGRSLSAMYERWLDRSPAGGPSDTSPFMRGNGSKIQKRIFTLMRKCDVQPPVDDLVWLVKQQPGMRVTAIRTLVHTNKPNDAFYKLLNILKRGTFVDDTAHIEFANFCIHARLRRTTKLLDGFWDAVEVLKHHGMIGAYAATLLLARAGTPDQLLAHADELKHRWKNDYWLGRAVAGLYPRLHGVSGHAAREFLQLLRSTNNPACERVLNHHFALMNDAAFVRQSSNYLKHDNESFPLRIFFPKALQLLSAKQNKSAADTYSAIIRNHPALANDAFFKTWGF